MSLWGKVGVAAGEVHDALVDAQGKPMSIKDLQTKTGLSSSMVYLALGWLLRGYKVTLDQAGRGYKVAVGRKG